MTTWPKALLDSPHVDRLRVAFAAASSAGAGLVRALGTRLAVVEQADQLKTPIDRAAEGWVLGWLGSEYPGEAALAEEQYARTHEWNALPTFWIVDALDGTRSYVDGYPGYCVQVAWIDGGVPLLGVIAEPATDQVYVAARGAGAWRFRDGTAEPIHVAQGSSTPLRFVDSTPPHGVVGRWMSDAAGSFVECGSVGLKIARIAEGSADVYAKEFRFRLWDVAPGQVVVEEAGGCLGLWNGAPIRYDTDRIEWQNLLAAPKASFDRAVARLGEVG